MHDFVCEKCPKYLCEKEKALDRNNSAFDAVIDMHYFTEDCKKNCTNENRLENKANF